MAKAQAPTSGGKPQDATTPGRCVARKATWKPQTEKPSASRRKLGSAQARAMAWRADGQVIHLGGQTATAEARLVGPDGKLYAHDCTTCLVFDVRPPAGKTAALA